MFVKELEIPRSYPNKYENKEYDKKLGGMLEQKTVEYRKYI